MKRRDSRWEFSFSYDELLLMISLVAVLEQSEQPGVEVRQLVEKCRAVAVRGMLELCGLR